MTRPTITDEQLRPIADRVEAIYRKTMAMQKEAAAAKLATAFDPGAKVYHSSFGDGYVVEAIGDDSLLVEFNDVGRKRLFRNLVMAGWLDDVFPVLDLSKITGPAPSRLTCAGKDPLNALEYAVWCIGETIMAFGGFATMRRVCDMLEDGEFGARIAVWLDHRWDGVRIGNDGWHA